MADKSKPVVFRGKGISFGIIKKLIAFTALQLAHEQRTAFGLRYNDFQRYRYICEHSRCILIQAQLGSIVPIALIG